MVTGAAGFVGYAVASRFVEAGCEVHGFTRSGAGLPSGVEPVHGDLLAEDSVRKAVAQVAPEVVCHLAAAVRVRESRTDPVRYWRTNVGGTLAVLDALAETGSGSAKLILASTCAVYGEPERQPIGENAEPAPSNPYGAGKLAADRAAADLAATGAIGAVSLRSFNVAGGLPEHPDRDESRLIPKVVAVAQGRATELVVNGDGTTVRDYVHVLDMADAFLAAVGVCEPGQWQAYNVGGGGRTRIVDVIATTERLTGKPLPVRHQAGAAEPPELIADPRSFQRATGWSAHRSGLEQILGDALAAARSAYAPGE
ncbi:NAD-dependent epimerase/dehydratase family protein [Kribbella amoyensis]|uniref:NAD-dependent epimerase/dehydratase family protein n=1 Tax=Kribbella amoyensis TaxID=996641 RepID=UPI00192DAD47|nr:NAD-dependent epimerase/dehydratase family protein [Kribbella amoyensis]